MSWGDGSGLYVSAFFASVPLVALFAQSAPLSRSHRPNSNPSLISKNPLTDRSLTFLMFAAKRLDIMHVHLAAKAEGEEFLSVLFQSSQIARGDCYILNKWILYSDINSKKYNIILQNIINHWKHQKVVCKFCEKTFLLLPQMKFKQVQKNSVFFLLFFFIRISLMLSLSLDLKIRVGEEKKNKFESKCSCIVIIYR